MRIPGDGKHGSKVTYNIIAMTVRDDGPHHKDKLNGNHSTFILILQPFFLFFSTQSHLTFFLTLPFFQCYFFLVNSFPSSYCSLFLLVSPLFLYRFFLSPCSLLCSKTAIPQGSISQIKIHIPKRHRSNILKRHSIHIHKETQYFLFPERHSNLPKER